jgi:hypothetical protein
LGLTAEKDKPIQVIYLGWLDEIKISDIGENPFFYYLEE